MAVHSHMLISDPSTWNTLPNNTTVTLQISGDCYKVIITLPVGAVAKYCDEHVCLSARISPEPHAQSLPVFLRMLPMAVARSYYGRVTKSQGEGTVLGFSPIGNAL